MKKLSIQHYFYFVFSVNAGIFLAYIIMGILAARNQLFNRADLTSHFTAWMMIQEGNKRQIYDLDLQQRYQQQILKDISFSEGLLAYNYPPHTALLFSLLGGFTLIEAFYIWMLIQILLLACLIVSIYNVLKPKSRYEIILIFSAILAFPPLFYNFLLGAFSLLMTLSIVKVYEHLIKNEQVHAGAWWLVSTLKPQFAILSSLILFISKKWKAVIFITISGILLFLWISYEMGWHIWVDYLRVLIRSGSQFGTYGIDPRQMYNIKAILTFILGKQNASWINLLSWTFFVVACLGIIIIWRDGKWESDSAGIDLKYSLAITLFIFSFPHVNTHDSFILVAAASLFYKYLIHQGSPSIKLFNIFILSWPLLFLLSRFANQIKILSWTPYLLITIFLFWQLQMLFNRRTSLSMLK